MKTNLTAGFQYLVEVLDKNGDVRESEIVKNIMPLEGLNHVLGVALKGVTPITAWYVGLYEGNYTPVTGDTAALFTTAATENITYDEATRPALTLGSVSGGTVDNSASKAVFTMNAAKTIYGGFISSASGKGVSTGVLLSAVRFSSPKSLGATDVLRITAGFGLASA